MRLREARGLGRMRDHNTYTWNARKRSAGAETAGKKVRLNPTE